MEVTGSADFDFIVPGTVRYHPFKCKQFHADASQGISSQTNNQNTI
jgi:hypothetical protein